MATAAPSRSTTDGIGIYLNATFELVTKKVEEIIAQVLKAVEYIFDRIIAVKKTLTDCYKKIKEMAWTQIDKLLEFGKAFLEKAKAIIWKVYTCVVAFFKRLVALPTEIANSFKPKAKPA